MHDKKVYSQWSVVGDDITVRVYIWQVANVAVFTVFHGLQCDFEDPIYVISKIPLVIHRIWLCLDMQNYYSLVIRRYIRPHGNSD